MGTATIGAARARLLRGSASTPTLNAEERRSTVTKTDTLAVVDSLARQIAALDFADDPGIAVPVAPPTECHEKSVRACEAVERY